MLLALESCEDIFQGEQCISDFNLCIMFAFLVFPCFRIQIAFLYFYQFNRPQQNRQSAIINFFLTPKSLQVVVRVQFQGISLGTLLFLTSWHASVGCFTALQQVAPLIISEVQPPSRSAHSKMLPSAQMVVSSFFDASNINSNRVLCPLWASCKVHLHISILFFMDG